MRFSYYASIYELTIKLYSFILLINILNINGEIIQMDAMLIWFLIGAIFILLELFSPLFVFIFFGIGAWAAALMTMIFPGIEQEIITFIVVAIATLLILRKKMLEIFQGKRSKVSLINFPHIGRQAEVTKDISSKCEGEISVGGSYWRATSNTLISTGSMVTVISCVENDELLLVVEPVL